MQWNAPRPQIRSRDGQAITRFAQILNSQAANGYELRAVATGSDPLENPSGVHKSYGYLDDNADPLARIEDSRRISTVILRGRSIDPRRLLDAARGAGTDSATVFVFIEKPTNADGHALQPSWCCIAMAPTEMLVRSM